MPSLPVVCEHCGHHFDSRSLKFGNNITDLTLYGNSESCPNCKKQTGLLEGRFNIHDGVINLIDGPQVTVDALKKIQEIIDSFDENKSQVDAEKEIELATGEKNFIQRFSDWAKRAGYLIDSVKGWHGRALFLAWIINEIIKIIDGN